MLGRERNEVDGNIYGMHRQPAPLRIVQPRSWLDFKHWRRNYGYDLNGRMADISYELIDDVRLKLTIDGKLTCTLEIRCDTLLGSLDKLSEGKAALVPEDGMLLPVTEVEFTGGNSVFDVFRQTLKNQKIHFEYVDASAYDSVYIEGIGNLYEFDCGPQSGWMYSVNGTYPGLGCSGAST